MPASFVQVVETEGSEPIGLPTEDDGTLSISTLRGQFSNCSGLKYIDPQTKNARGVRLSVDGKLHPPSDIGWNSSIFYCVFTKDNKPVKQTQIRLKCTNLKATTTTATLKKYFQSFGNVVAAKVNKGSKSSSSSAIITIIFNSDEAKKKIVEEEHEIDEQLCHVELVNFKQTKNTPGIGADYEILVPAYFALLLNKHPEVKNFTLRSNVSGFGNLDDLVIDAKIAGKRHYFSFQLKHKDDKDKRIEPTNFEAAGPFNLEQYCEAFRTLRKRSEEPDEDFKKSMKKGENRELFKNLKDELENYHFILYTNAHLNVGGKTKAVKYSMRAQDNLRNIDEIFNTSPKSDDSKCVYKFVGGKKEEQFFSQFSLFASQKNVDGFKDGILQILKYENVALKYVDFFKKWHGEKFTNKTLDKETFDILILDILMSPFIAIDRHLTKLGPLERAIKTFDLTIVADSMENFANKLPKWRTSNNLKEFFSDEMNKQLESFLVEFQTNPKTSHPETILSECMLRLAKERKIVDRETKELKIETKLKVLRYFFDKLLIIDCNNNSRDFVCTALDLCRIREIAVKLVLVGHDVDVAKYSHLTIFENLDDLKKERNLYEEIIGTCTLSLQGRKNILLEQLVKNFENIGEFVKTTEIFKMVTGNYSIGGRKEILPQNYVQRTVSTTRLGMKTVLDHCKKREELLIINFDGKFDECEHVIRTKQIQVTNIEDYLKLENNIHHSIVITREELSKHQFRNIRRKVEELCRQDEEKNHRRDENEASGEKKMRNVHLLTMEAETVHRKHSFEKKKEKNIHFLKMVDENSFMLVMSTKNTFAQTKNFVVFKREEEIHDSLTSPVNILTAQPGMGKSTMMKYLANKCSSDFWTIFVDLKVLNSFFRRERQYDEVTGHFLRSEQNEDSLSTELKAAFLERNKIAWFFDGLDEIESNCVGNVLRFIDAASETGHRVWVTSRQNLKEILESRFNIFPIGMEELSQEQQKQYVEERLHPKYGIQEIRQIVEKLFNNIHIKQNAQLLGVPLQLYIITQIFLDDRKNFEILNENMFILTTMYRLFCVGRYKHSMDKCESKNPHLIPFTLEDQFENYQVAALQSLFDDKTFAKLKLDLLLEKNRRFLTQIRAGNDPLGIIVKVSSENKAQFEHTTFAEYYACAFLTKHLDRARILKEQILSHKYRNLLLFLHIMLSEDNPLHLAVNQNDVDGIKRHLNDGNVSKVDKCGRTLLHTIAFNGTKHPNLERIGYYFIDDRPVRTFEGENEAVKRTVECVLQPDNDPFKNDELFGWNCLDYAFTLGALYVAEEILRKYGNPVDLNDTLQKYGEDRAILYYSFRYGYHKLLSSVFLKNNFSMLDMQYISFLEFSYCYQGSKFEFSYKPIVDFCFMSQCANKMEIIKVLIGANENKTTKRKVNGRTWHGFTLLHLAAIENEVGITEFLLSKGADADAPNSRRQTPLHFAASNGNIEIMRLLLDGGADPNATDDDNENALFYAVRGQNVEAIKFLLSETEVDVNATSKEGKTFLSKGADADASNSRRQTPLHFAASNGNIEIMRLLLDGGADPNATDDDNENALFYAVRGQNVEAIKFLLSETEVDVNATSKEGKTFLSKGADADASNSRRQTPLHFAASNGNIEIMRLLLDGGADPNATDDDNENALFYAVRGQNVEAIKFLLSETEVDVNATSKEGKTFLSKGADADASNSRRQTPLHFAASNGNIEIMRLLLDGGADPNATDDDNENALFYAVRGQNVEAIKFLLSETEVDVNATSKEGKTFLSKGADADASNSRRQTPLHFAASNGNIEIMRLLLDGGADPNATDDDNENALFYAVRGQNVEAIKFLLSETEVDVNATSKEGKTFLSKGADADASNSRRQTPLHFAASNGNIEIMRLLLDGGADPNATDDDNENALFYAVRGQNVEAIKFLLSETEVDVNATSNEGKTLLHHSLDSKDCATEILELLLKKTEVARLLDVADRRGLTILHYAIYDGRSDAVKLTLEQMNLTSVDVNNGNFPLHFALKDGHLDKKLLLEMADVIQKLPHHSTSNTDKIDILRRTFSCFSNSN